MIRNPATIGILGGGQLARMLALAGVPLGLRFKVLEREASCPAAPVSEVVVGDYHDAKALGRLAQGTSAVTFEFENVPAESVRALSKKAKVYPGAKPLAHAQDRLKEKNLFAKLDIPVAPYRAASSQRGVEKAIAEIGLPAVAKTRRMGYDGKGQAVLRTERDVAGVYKRLGEVPLLVESLVDFQTEVSILAVRSISGETAFYPLVENTHREGILRVSRAPFRKGRLQTQAETYAARLMDATKYVGVLALELFVSRGGLLANEFAPRVHNSGHWTIEGAVTSQFENHVRAVAGLPLGSTAVTGVAGMVNLIGTMPAVPSILSVEGAHLHHYGKKPRPFRKLGHVTVVERSVAARDRKIAAMESLLG